jgi:hypothetical protein
MCPQCHFSPLKVAGTLNYALADYSVSLAADAIGDTANAAALRNRSDHAWRTLWDGSYKGGFLRAKVLQIAYGSYGKQLKTAHELCHLCRTSTGPGRHLSTSSRGMGLTRKVSEANVMCTSHIDDLTSHAMYW